MKKSVLIVGLALLGMPLFAQKTENLLRVKGESVLSYTPEEMKIVVSIEAKDSVYADCSDMLVRTYNSIVNKLVAAGVDKSKIKSGKISLSENTKWNSEEREYVKDGYVGMQTVIVEVKYSNEQLTKIVNTLKADTLYFSYTIGFQLSEKQKNEALQLVIEGAIKDATNKAQIIANSTNVRLVKIKDINYNHTASEDDFVYYGWSADGYDNDNYYGNSVKKGRQDSFDNLIPMPIETKKSINIIWEIKSWGK
jgi:uncharacterized protein YggE